MSIGWTVACQHEGLWREDAGDVHAGALLGADIGAWDVSALRVRAAAIVMVAGVSAGLAWVNPTAAKYCWALVPFVHWAAEHWPAPPGGRLAHPAGKQQSTTRSPRRCRR